MRTKKRPPVASADITKAWSAFFADVAVEDPAELKKQGWMTNAEIATIAKMDGYAGIQLADMAVRKGKMEKKVAKIMLKGRRQTMNFYRPK